MYYQFRENPRFYDLLDTQEFVLWQWSYASFYGSSYGQNVAKYYGLGPENGNHYRDYASVPLHNSMADVLKSSGTWNHDINLSGGTEATNYSLGFNYLSDNGTHIRNQRERYSINFKLNQKINNKLSANFDVRYFENFSWGDGNNTGASNYYYRPVLNPLGQDNPALLGQGDSNVNTNYDPLLVTYNLEDFNRSHNLRVTAGLPQIHTEKDRPVASLEQIAASGCSLSSEALALFNQFNGFRKTFQELQDGCKLKPLNILAILTELELAGLVHTPDNFQFYFNGTT